MSAGAWILAVTLACAANAQEFSCARCHQEENKTQPFTPMAQAASRATDADILKRYPSLRFSNGGYDYRIAREDGRVKYSVAAGGKVFSTDLAWAFGFGSMGQTYFYEYRGGLYESQVSFYSALKGLDLTIGHRNIAQSDLALAAGRKVDKLEANRCFRCHTTGSTPGVQCVHCHTGAVEHADSFASGARSSVPVKLSGLSNEELSDFCGACHRTWQEVESAGPRDINNVRFQPYRLATSKCYATSVQDKRIGCVACHNPHRDVTKDAAYYDAKCKDCHNSALAQPVRACRIGTSGCVACHMPKVDFPSGHFQFTDHRIRIVRGSAYPG